VTSIIATYKKGGRSGRSEQGTGSLLRIAPVDDGCVTVGAETFAAGQSIRSGMKLIAIPLRRKRRRVGLGHPALRCESRVERGLICGLPFHRIRKLGFDLTALLTVKAIAQLSSQHLD
jgi:hypothetical protein